MRAPSRYRRSIVEIILRDAKASANAKVLNLWVKVYMDINDLSHSDREEDMDSDIEEEDIDSDAEEDMEEDMEEDDIDSDTEEDMDSAAVLIAHHVALIKVFHKLWWAPTQYSEADGSAGNSMSFLQTYLWEHQENLEHAKGSNEQVHKSIT
ncbi:hypothetical protein ACLB2K_030441 [Fragaria x ananassa]